MSRPLITALIGRHGPLYPQDELPGTSQAGHDASQDPPAPQSADDQPSEGRAAAAAGQEQEEQQPEEEQPEARPYHCQPAAGAYPSRYAGAMLTHAFTTAIGAAGILQAGCGLAGADAAADLAVLNATAMGFTLGALTLEQTKHLQARDAGPLTGLSQLPGLRAWRQRLGAIGDQVDPLALQRRMTAALLAHLPPAHQVFLADDHIAEYTGSKPVGWGRNPRRGKATKAHDDTYVCDLSGRALVVASGEPSGLSLTLPPVLAQLTQARKAATAAGSSNPGRPVVVFDRGGSYPKTFKAVHAAGYDWISWRRAPLAATSRLPVLATIRQYGTDRMIAFTDEVIALDGYPGPVRQISLFEHGKMVAQLLTSCLRLCAGALPGLLRSRWIIENFLKYNAANYGIDTLADYTADLADDTRLTANPAYAQAKKAEQAGVLAFSWTFPLCCFWCRIVKLALVIRWAYLAEPTLFPDVIVISLDVVEHGGPDLARVAPHVLIDQLLLDRRIKRFRCRVVVAYAGVPDRRDNTLGEKAIAVPSRGILGPAVMVHHKLAYTYSRPAGGQRIIHGLEHQARAHVVINGPTDDLIRAHVNKRRQVRETRIRPDIRNIADPQLVRLRRGELAVHQIDQAADCPAVLHGRPRRRPGMHALQARRPRQAAHPPPGGDVPFLLQVPQDPLDAGPVLMPFLMQVPDPRGQLNVLLIMRRDRPLLPLVKSLPRHFQHAAHENNGKAHSGRQLPLLFRHLANEQEFHRFWLAKYALAFFRNAFSMLRRRTSASSSLIRVRSAGVSGASPTATASLSLSFLTQLARVDSFSPRFRAVSAIV